MEFLLFLTKLDKEILELIIKANYIVKENTIECLSNRNIAGLHNFKENKIIICTDNAKRKTNYREIKYYSDNDNFKTKKAIRKANKLMGRNGRLLVRKSGTEPKIRIMGESHNKNLIIKCIKIIKQSIKY